MTEAFEPNLSNGCWMSVAGAKGKMRKGKTLPIEDKAQSEGFLKYAIEHGLDTNPEAFERALTVLARNSKRKKEKGRGK